MNGLCSGVVGGWSDGPRNVSLGLSEGHLGYFFTGFLGSSYGFDSRFWLMY